MLQRSQENAEALTGDWTGKALGDGALRGSGPEFRFEKDCRAARQHGDKWIVLRRCNPRYAVRDTPRTPLISGELAEVFEGNCTAAIGARSAPQRIGAPGPPFAVARAIPCSGAPRVREAGVVAGG